MQAGAARPGQPLPRGLGAPHPSPHSTSEPLSAPTLPTLLSPWKNASPSTTSPQRSREQPHPAASSTSHRAASSHSPRTLRGQKHPQTTLPRSETQSQRHRPAPAQLRTQHGWRLAQHRLPGVLVAPRKHPRAGVQTPPPDLRRLGQGPSSASDSFTQGTTLACFQPVFSLLTIF